MARTTRTTVSLLIECWETNTAPGVAGGQPTNCLHRFTVPLSTFESGTGDGTFDRVWSADNGSASVTAGTPVSLDLAGSAQLPSKLDGSLNVNFADMGILAVAHKGASGNLEVGAGSNPWVGMLKAAGDINVIGPGGFLVWYAGPAGMPTTGGTGDLLQLLATAGTIPFDALLIGRSA